MFWEFDRCSGCWRRWVVVALGTAVCVETVYAGAEHHGAKTDMGGSPHAPEEPTDLPKPPMFYTMTTTTQPPPSMLY